jgi:hypothetical protein
MKGGYIRDPVCVRKYDVVDKAIADYNNAKTTGIDYVAVSWTPNIQATVFRNFLEDISFPMSNETFNKETFPLDREILKKSLASKLSGCGSSSRYPPTIWTFIIMRAIVHLVSEEVSERISKFKVVELRKNKKFVKEYLLKTPTFCVRLFLEEFLKDEHFMNKKSRSTALHGGALSWIARVKRWFSKYDNNVVQPIQPEPEPELNDEILVRIDNYITHEEIPQPTINDKIACPFLMIPQYDQPVCVYISFLTIILTSDSIRNQIITLATPYVKTKNKDPEIDLDLSWAQKTTAQVDKENFISFNVTRDVTQEKIIKVKLCDYIAYLLYPLVNLWTNSIPVIEWMKYNKGLLQPDAIDEILRFKFDVYEFVMTLFVVAPNKFPTFLTQLHKDDHMQIFDKFIGDEIAKASLIHKNSGTKILLDCGGVTWFKNLIGLLFSKDVPTAWTGLPGNKSQFVVKVNIADGMPFPLKNLYSCLGGGNTIDKVRLYESHPTHEFRGCMLNSLVKNCNHYGHAIAFIKGIGGTWYLYNGWQKNTQISEPCTRNNVAISVELRQITGKNFVRYIKNNYPLKLSDHTFNEESYECNGNHTLDFSLTNFHIDLYEKKIHTNCTKPAYTIPPDSPSITPEKVQYLYDMHTLSMDYYMKSDNIILRMIDGIMYIVSSSTPEICPLFLEQQSYDLKVIQIMTNLWKCESEIPIPKINRSAEDIIKLINESNKNTFDERFVLSTCFCVNTSFYFVINSSTQPFAQHAITIYESVSKLTSGDDISSLYTDTSVLFRNTLPGFNNILDKKAWLMILGSAEICSRFRKNTNTNVKLLCRNLYSFFLITSFFHNQEKIDIEPFYEWLGIEQPQPELKLEIPSSELDIIAYIKGLLPSKLQGGRKIMTMMEYHRRYAPSYYTYLTKINTYKRTTPLTTRENGKWITSAAPSLERS